MQKSNSPAQRFLSQFGGVVLFMLMQVISLQTITAQLNPVNTNLPYFSLTAGTVLSNTNGNWATVRPQQPDNIDLLETNLYEMPHRGSGLGAVEFILVGADGGTANYKNGAISYLASGGQGAQLTYTLTLDSSTSGKPFIVTFGKKGESTATNLNHYCSAGGGGASGMAWVIPNEAYYQLNFYDGEIPVETGYLIAAAGGGGGGFATDSGPSANGQGANVIDMSDYPLGIADNCFYYRSVSTPDNAYTELFSAGGSMLENKLYEFDSPNDAQDQLCKTASSISHNVLNFQTGFLLGGGSVLQSVTYGQGGGKPTDEVLQPHTSTQAALNIGQTFLLPGSAFTITITSLGGAGGCGFAGGGAGSSTSSYQCEYLTGFPTGGGGGDGSSNTSCTPGTYPGGGSAGYSTLAHYLHHTSINPVTTTAAPQSGYFAYRTIRDTIPPVIGISADTLYIGNDFEGFPNTSVTISDNYVRRYCSDNDSIKTITFSKTVFNCSDLLSPEIILVTATDFAGNYTTRYLTVTVLDTAQPFVPFQSPPNPFDPGSYAPYTIDVTTGPYTLNAYNFPAGEDGCDNNLTIHFTPATYTCAQAGTQQSVSYYYTNDRGQNSPVYVKTFNVVAQNYPVLYVDASASGTNNGSSWADAFTSLQDALTYGCSNNRTIYVAQGTYYPDHGHNVTLGDRSASFITSQNFNIYGGFPSGGAVFNARNPSAYPTILSGNIGSILNTNDNSYHVVTITGNNTVLDGITIQDGYANDTSGLGGGIFFYQNSPGTYSYNITLNRCNLFNNFGNKCGGAYINYNSIFYYNNISITNCIFQGNSTSGNGGAVYFNTQNLVPNTRQSLVNCLFSGNTAANGGAIYAAGSAVSLTNCTFSQNNASMGGGAYYNAGGSTTSSGNNIFYYDSAGGAQNEIENSGAFNVSFSDIQGGGGSGNWNNAIGTDNGNNIDANPDFITYGGGPFAILPNSPCRNRGNTSYNNQPLDLVNVIRVAQDTIDIGAYEVNPVVYVAADANNGGNGQAWATAYNNLQDGLNNADTSIYPKDVWVKTGTYYPDRGTDGNNDARFNTFNIIRSLDVYGGFAGNETSITQRNIGANPTILSGDLGVLGDNSDNAYHVITLNASSPHLNGLIIEGGNANYTNNLTYESGGAIYDEGYYNNPYPVATNCVFRNNSAIYYAGAVYVAKGNGNYNFDFIQCLFYNNTALRGGAVYVQNGQPDTSAGANVVARFYNCTGINNTASGFNTGGFCESNLVNGGYSNAATAQFNNCLLLNDGSQATTALHNANTIYNNTYAGSNNNDLVNINDPAGPDSLIMTADDGFKLQPGSNAINYGGNAFIYPGNTTDIAGGARIKQLVVDAGAYENWGCLGAAKLYVDANVDTSNGDGRSWGTAFRYLGDALKVANVCPLVDTIFIAQGTYYPCGNLNSQVTIDTSFDISKPVKIFGGYPTGGGTRNVLQYPVILSGAINTQTDSFNARHIMLIASGNADTTLIDGITFANGYAYNGSSYFFNGKNFRRSQGGGISANNSLVKVNNCVFQNNQASDEGAAVYAYGGKFISMATIYQNNAAYNSSGALCFDGSADTIVLIGNVFVHNSAGNGNGGAVGVIYTGASYANVENNVFALNRAGAAGGSGGGCYINAGNFKVANNTFYGNSAAEAGGFYESNVYDSTALLANNLFWQNTLAYNGDTDYYVLPGVMNTGNVVNTPPLFLDTANLLGADGIWFTADDGLELKPASTVINTGNNSAVDANTDITGAARIQLGIVDPGAYESNTRVAHWYVSQAQDSLPADGASWATAFQKFPQGVNAAKYGDTLWVAAGNYVPDSIGTSFSMKSGVKIYGGFNASEQLLTERNLGSGYNAILQGNGASVLVNSQLDTSSLLDGFVITNGNSATQGGGMLNDTSSPLIRNVVFTGNMAATDGGAMANIYSSPVLQNVVFNADTAGGVSGRGGAIFSSASKLSITNATFYNNAAVTAGAIYSDASSQLTVANSVFNNNTAQGSADIYTTQTNNFTYCLLQYARSGTGNLVAVNPNFNYAQNPAGFDGLWFTGDDGLYLGYFSAGLNSGSNSLVTGLATDITGAARIQNGTVDVGAYESPWLSYCDSVGIKNQNKLYVDGSQPASGDGSSWLNAFVTLGEALDRANACSTIDTILVAKGTYYPTGWRGLTDRTATFNILRSGLHLQGGYPNRGGKQNTGLNNTWLSGDIGVEDSMPDNSFHVVTFTSAGANSGLDGFIITSGNADGASSFSYGGGIFNNGAGDSSVPVISNCVLVNNHANFGGAVFNQGQLSGNASACFTNCVFTGDTASVDGGAMYNSGLAGNASPMITNCTFYGNYAGTNAGAIYDYGAGGNCATRLLNCIVWGNNAANGSVNQKQIFSNSASDSIFYSIIQDSIPSSIYDGGQNIFADPLFASDSLPIGFNGAWADEFDGLAVKVGSPAVRKGRLTGAPVIDMTGASRAPIPDMGAYQLQDTAHAGLQTITTTACDSFLSPSYKYEWYTSGIYNDTTTNILGNDTFYTVNLTLGRTGYNTINPSTCGSYISPAGRRYDSTGVYHDTLQTASGCDSLITINLVVASINDTVTANGATCACLQSNATYQWIDCNASRILSGATQQTFTATHNGSYACIVTQGNCTDTTNCVSVTDLGVEEVSAYHFNLYPNPTSGVFTVESNYNMMLTARIVDAASRLVKEFTLKAPFQQLDISELAGGVYNVIILNNKQQLAIKKLVKQ